jgi:hypothetical protein
MLYYELYLVEVDEGICYTTSYTTSFTWSKSCSTAAAMAGFPVPEEAGRSREGKKGKKGKKDVTFDFIEHV